MPSPALMRNAQGSLRGDDPECPVVNLEHHASAPGRASRSGRRTRVQHSELLLASQDSLSDLSAEHVPRARRYSSLVASCASRVACDQGRDDAPGNPGGDGLITAVERAVDAPRQNSAHGHRGRELCGSVGGRERVSGVLLVPRPGRRRSRGSNRVSVARGSAGQGSYYQQPALGKNISRVLCIVTLHSKYTRALTFDLLFCVRGSSARRAMR